MAKHKPKIQDQGSAMERILGIKKSDNAADNTASAITSAGNADTATPVAQPPNAETPAVKPPTAITQANRPPSAGTVTSADTPEERSVKEDTKKGRAAKKQPYVQTAFYITKKQHKALKIRAARGDDPNEKDMSAIVRAALDAYLGL